MLRATSGSYGGPYFGNHVRFFFRERGIGYAVTLHSFGNEETTALLGRLIGELRPAATLHAPAPPQRGTTIRIGRVGAEAIAPGPRALWVLGREHPIHPAAPWEGTTASLVALDPNTGAVRKRLSVRGGGRDVATGAGSVWVAAAEARSVLRIDPKRRRVVARVRTGNWPTSLAVGRAGVWVVNAAPFYRRGTLVYVDSATNRLRGRPVPLGRAPSGVAVAAGAVWVADSLDRTVLKIDPSSRRVRATIHVGRQPYGLTFAAGSLWVTNSDATTVTRIDGSTNVARTIRVGRNPYGICSDRRSVWTANLGEGTVAQIDASSGRLLQKIRMGTDPVAVAIASGAVWVMQNSDGSATRLPSSSR